MGTGQPCTMETDLNTFSLSTSRLEVYTSRYYIWENFLFSISSVVRHSIILKCMHEGMKSYQDGGESAK